MATATELKAQMLGMADEDGELRARLIADPNAAISSVPGAAHGDIYRVRSSAARSGRPAR